MVAENDWVVKESASHAGSFYRYNKVTGDSQWLNQEGAPQKIKSAALHKSKSLDKGNGRRPASRSSRMTNVSWGTDDTAGGSECVCTICECGKHACPVHKWEPTQFGGNSRYREDFPAHPVRPKDRDLVRKAARTTVADPDHFKSKYGEDYLGYVPDPPVSMKPKAAPPTSTPFNATTTNQELFCAKPLENRSQRRPASPMKRPTPFEGTTTNQDQFQSHPNSKPRESMAPPVRTIASAPFDGLTAYKKDYVIHDHEGQKKMPHSHGPYAYGPPRNLDTENRSSYTKKEIGYCPVLDLQPKDPSQHTGHMHYSKGLQPEVRYYPGKK